MAKGDSHAQVYRYYYHGDPKAKSGKIPFELGQDGDEPVEIIDF